LAELFSENGYTTKSNLQSQLNVHPNPSVILHRIRKINPKIHTGHRRTQISKAILNKKGNAEDIKIPDFQLYYKVKITEREYTHTKTDTSANEAE
jgi:hypothetical protein